MEEKLSPKKLKDFLETELVKFKLEVESGEYLKPEKTSFEHFALNEWKTKFAERKYSPRTKSIYLVQLNTHILPVFGHRYLEQIKTIHIIDFINHLEDKGLKDSSVLYIYKVLKSIIDKAVEWEFIVKNPLDGVRQPKVQKKKMKFLDEKQAQKVIASLNDEPDVWRLYFLGWHVGGI